MQNARSLREQKRTGCGTVFFLFGRGRPRLSADLFFFFFSVFSLSLLFSLPLWVPYVPSSALLRCRLLLHGLRQTQFLILLFIPFVFIYFHLGIGIGCVKVLDETVSGCMLRKVRPKTMERQGLNRTLVCIRSTADEEAANGRSIAAMDVWWCVRVDIG